MERLSRIIVLLICICFIQKLNPVLASATVIPNPSEVIYGSEISMAKPWLFFNESTRNIKVHLKNTGNITWISDKEFHLSYHLLDSKGNVLLHDGVRTNLPKDVQPDESIDIIAQVQSPEKAGSYQIQWDMVQEKVTWFSEKNPYNSITYDLNIISYYHFISLVIIVICTLLLATYILEKKKIIKIPRIFKSILVKIWSKADIIWFVIAISLKINYFSDLSHIIMTPDAKRVSFMFALLLGIVFNTMKHRKLRVAILFSINIIVSTFILGDLIYLEYFDNVLSLPVLLYMSQAASVKGSIFELFHTNQLYVYIDMIIGIVLLLLPQKLYFQDLRMLGFLGSFLNKKIQSGIVFVICSSILYLNVQAIGKDNPGIFIQRFSNSKIVENIGVMNYHVFDAYKFISMSFSNSKVTTDQILSINNWFKINSSQAKNADFGISKGKNVIVLQVEALQQFVIGLNINGQEVTPNLNKLIKESIYYDNYFDQTNQGRTSDGEFTSMVSLYPLNEGSVYFSYPQQNYDSLPNALKQNGYTTFSAHAYDGQFWNRKAMHHHLGIDSSMFGNDFTPGENIGWGLSDKDFLEQSVQKISTLPQPFFSFLITLSNHHPYDALPAQYKVFDEKEGSMLDRYLNTAHYTDMAIGAFIDQLKQKGLYDNTVLAIYGDHDSAIDIKDMATVVKTGTDAIDAAKMDKVPLIIHIPGYTKNTTSSTVAGHLDLTPSLLHLLGISTDNHFFMGNDLFESDPSRIVVFRNGSYVDQSHYFLTSSGSIQEGLCYDLKTNNEIANSACVANANEAQKRLEMSDLVIQANLVPRLKAANEDN
ncbi:sulfatase-like hydrolase/transferase [Paenibacillus sp. OAS669]|uniref:sulfatase-like hydrolase/transferase n=1 Tax=Paenibacillus sp. OAS669 TaxID=2663821 RepID=UPI00178AF7A0|nr:sulfatase-like hydrolase/transferase [Paenibacillus sp. OAS669]MBE1445662.1 phosphoglycerol transferase MdoB-like AlkP superfamily enzyme [Paenibacillus sp. OAS669]